MAYLNTNLVFNTFDLLADRNLLNYSSILTVEEDTICYDCNFIRNPADFNCCFEILNYTNLHLVFQHFFNHLIIVHLEILNSLHSSYLVIFKAHLLLLLMKAND